MNKPNSPFAEEKIKFTSRYEALGMPLPDPDTMCKGECEGTGWYPENLQEPNVKTVDYDRWTEAHNKGNFIKRFWHKYRCDGWHFIKCADCNGTGKLAQLKKSDDTNK